MSKSHRRTWLRPHGLAPLVAATASALAFLVPPTLGATSASAAPSPGYTASYIPAGTGTPVSVAVNAATDTVYLGDSADQLIVINAASHATVATIGLAGLPRGIAVDPASSLLPLR